MRRQGKRKRICFRGGCYARGVCWRVVKSGLGQCRCEYREDVSLIFWIEKRGFVMAEFYEVHGGGLKRLGEVLWDLNSDFTKFDFMRNVRNGINDIDEEKREVGGVLKNLMVKCIQEKELGEDEIVDVLEDVYQGMVDLMDVGNVLNRLLKKDLNVLNDYLRSVSEIMRDVRDGEY